MSFSEPAKLIDHIPQDFDMKRITPMRPLEQRQKAKDRRRRDCEPCDRFPLVFQISAFIGALAVVFCALITGVLER